jgi:high-affinity iron transporter
MLAAFIIYASGSRLTLHIFLVTSTCVLLLIGAGMLSSACGHFQTYVFNKIVGADVEELGNGPGSFDVRGNVWHLVSVTLCFRTWPFY